MLMPTFLQMSQRYVQMTAEWQRRGKNKKRNEKEIKCTGGGKKKKKNHQHSGCHHSRIVKRYKKMCLKIFPLHVGSKERSGPFLKAVPIQHGRHMITETFQKITRKPQKLFTAVQSSTQTEVLHRMHGRVIRIRD